MNLSELRQRSLEIEPDPCRRHIIVIHLRQSQNNKAPVRCYFHSHIFLTLLCLFFLAAAIVEVQVMCGNLQTTRNNRHNGDELTVFRENQFFFLALIFSFHPESIETSCDPCLWLTWEKCCQGWLQCYRNVRLTCYPKRPGPPPLIDHPPCHWLLLP